jgi:hypothetical protein
MKRLIALLLLVAFVGGVYANVVTQRRQPRPLVNLALASFDQPGPLVVPFLRMYAPLWLLVGVRPDRVAVGPDIPVPPVCNLSCRLRPVQGLVQ